MSTFTDLARESFGFLERRGFGFHADNSNLPAYDEAHFENRRMRVRVYWEQRDGVVVTYLGRRRPLGLGVRELGLSFLGDLDDAAHADGIHEQSDPRLGKEIGRQAELLRSRGEGLLKGEREAWDALAARQRAYRSDFKRS